MADDAFGFNTGVFSVKFNNEDFKAIATVGDVIKCVESKCTNSENCSTFAFWEGLNKAINDYIDSTTLADLALREKAVGDEKARCEK